MKYKEIAMYLPAVLLAITLGYFFADQPSNNTVLTQLDQQIAKQNINTELPNWKTQLSLPQQLTFNPAKNYYWQLNTSEGDLVIKLLPDVAPMHVSSTMYLTRLGFYDDLTFHRVIPGFMAQGGDPLGTGRGDPGFRYAGEFSPDALHNKAGVLSMANAGPNTDGSQFFITFRPTPHLNGRHTVFGHVTEGLSSTLTKMEMLSSRRGTPKAPIKIIKADILIEDKQG